MIYGKQFGVATCICAGLLSTAAMAEASDQDVAALVTAIEEAGCVVTIENGDAVLASSGLGEQAVYDVIALLYEGGLVALQEDGTMKLTNETCP